MQDAIDRIIAQWEGVRPEVDVSAMRVIGRISRLSRILERELNEVFAAHGLQAGEFDLLATLRRTDTKGRGLTAGQLAESALVTSGAITNRLDRLLAKGLITRETDPESRRAIRIALTARGREVVDEALIDHVANEERILSAMDASERAAIEGLLRALLIATESQDRGSDLSR